MAGKKSVIETGVDKLVKLISDRKKISVKEAAKELGVSVSSVEEWADFLEEEGIISIQSQFATVYLVEKKVGKKELAEKVKAVRDEKESFVRRIESSINVLERDREEIKLIDSEFRKIKDLLEDRFEKLSKKLGKLEDFRKTHREIELKCRELEEDYEKKLKDIEKRMKGDEKDYKEVLETIEEELQKIKAEREKVSEIKGEEKHLQSKVDEVDRLISHVRKEMEKGNEQLAVDEERLKKSEETARKIKEDIAATSKELESVSKEFSTSRKELESMENTFLKDLASLDKGELEKIGPYKESRDIVDKFKKFFSQTGEIESLIRKAEKEEEELREHFDNLSKKARAFSVVTSVPEIKKEMAGLHKELLEIESRKDLLSGQLKKMRTVVRAIIK
jgi:chromosome segregation ATPase